MKLLFDQNTSPDLVEALTDLFPGSELTVEPAELLREVTKRRYGPLGRRTEI